MKICCVPLSTPHMISSDDMYNIYDCCYHYFYHLILAIILSTVPLYPTNQPVPSISKRSMYTIPTISLNYIFRSGLDDASCSVFTRVVILMNILLSLGFLVEQNNGGFSKNVRKQKKSIIYDYIILHLSRFSFAPLTSNYIKNRPFDMGT